MKRSLFIVTILVFSFSALQAQITSPGANASDATEYPVFTEIDSIFIFCSNDSLANVAALTAGTELTGAKNWLWEKYNNETASFESYYEESTDAAASQIDALADGCYRITITQGGTTEIDRAWVFNNRMFSGGEVTVSDCEHFVIEGEMNSAVLTYYDLSNNTPVFVNKNVQVEWLVDGTRISTLLNLTVYDPPTENTNYTLRVYDKFGCDAQATIEYESIVTKAKFSVDANWSQDGPEKYKGEAPLTVTFTNESENGTAGYYEWFFYRDLNEIKQEADGGAEEIDSIMLVAFDDAPIYTFENTGIYMVKLVSKHLSDSLTCVDTAYLDDYIVADSSAIAVPNVFTPNGDGINDYLKFNGIENSDENELIIYNRWGTEVIRIKNYSNEFGWDGKNEDGNDLPEDTYYYILDVTDDGVTQTHKGFIVIKRY